MIRRLRSRCHRGKTSVSAQGVCILCRMQKIFRVLRASQRPVILFAPLIRTHHENFHRLAGKFVLRALEKILVPLQGELIFVVLSRGRSKVDIANFSSAASVSANRHQEMLATTGSFTSPMCLDSDVVPQRSTLENVIPGRDVEHRNIDVSEMFFDRQLLPVFVVVGMRQPIQEIWSQCAGGDRRSGWIRKIEQRIACERKFPRADYSVGVFLHHSIKRVFS